jgi:hypothetical protein
MDQETDIRNLKKNDDIREWSNISNIQSLKKRYVLINKNSFK